MSRDYFDISCIFKFGWKRLIAAIVMFIVILFANNIISHQLIAFIVQVVLGIVTYVLCLLIMRDRFLLDNIKNMEESYYIQSQKGCEYMLPIQIDLQKFS